MWEDVGVTQATSSLMTQLAGPEVCGSSGVWGFEAHASSPPDSHTRVCH
jgi:hypothetical protein